MVETFYEWVTHTCINESLKHVYVLVLHREGFVCSIKKYACITSMDIEEIWKQNDKNHIPCIEFRNCRYLLKMCVLLNDNKLFILKAGNIYSAIFSLQSHVVWNFTVKKSLLRKISTVCYWFIFIMNSLPAYLHLLSN